MARGRVIKPSFFGDVTLSEVCRDARMLYVGLWGHMDRRGVMEYHPKLVKKDVFPYDEDVGVKQIADWVNALVGIKRLYVIEHAGKQYLFGPYLKRHQHFNVKEKPNHLIPKEVLEQCEHIASTVLALANGVVPAPNEHGADTPDTDTDTDTETDTEAEAECADFAPLTAENLAVLKKQFAPELLKRHLRDAIAWWEAKDAFFKSQRLPIQTVMRYLIVARDGTKQGQAPPQDFTPEQLAEIQRIEAGGRR